MIPDGIVEEVRARADIVEIIGEHVPLKRRGKDYWATCPFHKEKTPSFHVVGERGFFKCFGCGESGDVFSFLMKYLGLTFQDSIRQLAERVGVEIPERASGHAAEDPNKLIYEAVAFAADFYRRQLWEAGTGERARQYLEMRGIGREAAERFLLGYAPDEWRGLRDAARKHGIEDEILLDAGLIKTSERSDEPYDRLRNRLVFPITDAGGRIIAFGGRILGPAREGAPKYLNSPETPIYHKGSNLYGLAWAKAAIRKEGVALVVEGYMDYVSLAAHGIHNVLAGLGTAMTSEQASLVGRYTRQALLLYDSDPAGLRATFRTADALLGAGVHPLVVTLPPGEDPDSVARRGGAAALKPYLDAAVDVLDRKLQILEERGYFQGAEGTRKALDGLLPTLRAAKDPALRDIYVARVAERTGVRRETLEAELEPEPTFRPRRRPEPAPPPKSKAPSGQAEQRMLLLLLLRDESRIPQAAEALSPDKFTDPVLRELFAELVRKGGLQGQGPMALELSDEGRIRLEELMGDPVEFLDGDRTFREVIGDIRAQALFDRVVMLKSRLRASEGEEQFALFRELTDTKRELQAIGSELTSLGFKLSRRYRKYLRS